MNEIFADDVVIGSGPTGWAACMGVWARGGQPLIIDIGYTALNHTSESVIGNPMVKSKSRFGSEHMYSFPLSKFEMSPPTKPIPLSGAIGGLSTVWGAGIQPVSSFDLAGVPNEVGLGWLLASKELLKKMDFLGRSDLLSHRDPWPIEPHDQVVTSLRFRKILNRADNKKDIGSKKVLFGSPRLAITGSSNRGLKGACTLCGQCMSGCPEDSIFDSGKAIQKGILEFGGQYVQGIATKLSSLESDIVQAVPHVEVEVHLEDGSTLIVKARRIYLAAGPIGTPIILQKSGFAPPVLDVRDSQMFYGAFASIDRYEDNNQTMSTSQGYFSTSSAVSREEEFSLSIYEYSNDFKNRLEQMVPRLIRPLVKLIAPLTRRVLPGIGFLSQDVSGLIRLNFDGARTILSFHNNPKTKHAIHIAKKNLGRTSRRLGLFPLANPFATPSVGAGFHAGASMPMGSDASHLIDWNGKLKAEECIRIVDATSLMRIKAGSHTFMAMANAYRIASKLDV